MSTMIQGYNAQAAVDAFSQVIVARGLTWPAFFTTIRREAAEVQRHVCRRHECR